jgi:SAM-dependent methyltransferase
MSIKQYDVPLNTDKNNSDWKILQYIKPKSIVLEFGPAYGRMTKYMKKKLGCEVYIVEIDNEAYQEAIKYAKGGVCGNILNFLWIKKFKGLIFDHIIFADVLEHLLDPIEALGKSVSLLKEDGSVLVSIPNMAHSSIIIDLLKNKLEYKNYGLLDKTHIKFFTYYSLVDMLESCSLIPVIEDGVITIPENTEFKNSYKNITNNTEVIENKIFANVYQFVFKCIKKEYYLKNKDTNPIQKIYDDKSAPSSIIFLDTGSGFNADEYMIIPLNKQENRFEIEINIKTNVKRIRFDPYEGYACIIDDLQIITNNGVIGYTYTNGICINNFIIFDTIDPQIAIDINNKAVSLVKIKGDIYRYNFDDISLLSKCKWIFELYLKIEDINKALAVERDRLVIESNNLVAEKNDLIVKRDELITERNDLISKYPELNLQKCTLYINTGNGYSEKKRIIHSFKGNEIEISCKIPENAITIRLDPIEGYGCIINNLEILSFGGIVNYELVNGYKDKDRNLVFINTDPQIEIHGAEHWLKIKYRITPLSDFSYYRIFNNFIAINQERDGLVAERDNLVTERDGLVAERDNLVTERDGLVAERDNLVTERDGLVAERDNLVTERDGLVAERDNLVAERDGLVAEHYELTYEKAGLITERDQLIVERDNFINSRSWRLTKPLRDLTAFIRKHKVLYLFVKGLLSLKRNGIVKTIKKITKYIQRKMGMKYSLSEQNNIYKNLLYESEYQNNIDYSKYEPKVKAIAFYLPQFHAIPENDKWWGEGFTEWTNTRKAKPSFIGHYQPHIPHKDIGYYNLTNVKTLEKQVKLAKQHGIYGFCFYFYWFSGKQLLEKPLDLFLEHPEIDINFCLCWANENWTRVWDGQDKEVLIRQNYTSEDPYKFINNIKKYIIDKRYIKINNAPVILVYNPGKIPDVKNVFKIWREYAIENGIGDIKIWICRTFGNTPYNLNIADVVDGEVEFPPHELFVFQQKNVDLQGKKAYIYSYNEIVNHIIRNIKNEINNTNNKLPMYRTCMLGWDNAARKVSEWTTFAGFSLKTFFKWNNTIINEALKKYSKEEAVIFINAWNEWAEGTHLEPDEKYGYSSINTLSKAICGLQLEKEKHEKL